jgi:hypothetical protein
MGNIFEVWDFHGGKHLDCGLLGYATVYVVK